MRKFWKEELEMGVLGSMIVDESCTPSSSFLREEMWFDTDNRAIFNAMRRLEERGEKIDLLTVKNELDASKSGIQNSYLINVANSIYTSTNFASYCKKMREEHKRAEVVRLASELQFRAEGGNISSDVIFDYSNRLLNFSTGGTDKYEVGVEAYESLTQYLDERKGKDLFGYSFGKGFEFIDKYTRGIQKGKTYRIGAPSNEGKTQLTYSMINSVLSQGAKVVFFTLENDNNFTLTNLCANFQKVNSYRIERGEEALDTDYVSSLKEKFFLIDDTYELSEIFARIQEIKPDVVFLDFIGQVDIKGTDENSKYGEYARRVQKFVKRSRVSWIDLSNLPKSAEDEDSIKATGGFFGDSALKNLADVGIHLYRFQPFNDFKNSLYGTEWYDKVKNLKVVGLYISKNRLGVARVGTNLKINFDKWGEVSEAKREEVTNWEMSFPSTSTPLKSKY